jgi:hypothetical protein
MRERVIAIDPGERAGWAAAIVEENRISSIEHGVLAQTEMALELARCQGIQPTEDPPLQLWRQYGVIVYETWRPRPKNGSMNWIQGNQLLSAQLVGQIRLLGRLSGAKLVGYGPDKKTVALASMPGALRARMDGCHEQHDQDALMHLWMYAWDNWATTTPDKFDID